MHTKVKCSVPTIILYDRNLKPMWYLFGSHSNINNNNGLIPMNLICTTHQKGKVFYFCFILNH